MRGEYSTPDTFASRNMELPPRARRIRAETFYTGQAAGTTSACAENTAGASRKLYGVWNYLRVRGEYCPGPKVARRRLELPPRARRIPFDRVCYLSISGTTSACAENTSVMCGFVIKGWNYLRVRGEYGADFKPSRLIWELPPRARRIQAIEQPFDHIHGTTSACAENTGVLSPSPTRDRNYLRVRGEYDCLAAIFRKAWELPPRARRILETGLDSPEITGTTSACAENTHHHDSCAR